MSRWIIPFPCAWWIAWQTLMNNSRRTGSGSCCSSQKRVIGGPQLLVGSVEFEHRFLKHWGVATFYDIGNAVNRFTDPLASGATGCWACTLHAYAKPIMTTTAPARIHQRRDLL